VSTHPNHGHGIDDISGIDETEKRYLLSTLVDKGLISSYIDYYSLTDKGRKKILEERKKKKLSK
jgi:DNA-binding PadR family transcriptional regulator